MQEHLVGEKLCRICRQSFYVTDRDISFYEQISPRFWWFVGCIPPPSCCPACRRQRRLSFRNERHVYKRRCAASGKDILAMYSPDSPYIVYDAKIWRSDERTPFAYGLSFDFSRSFTSQFDGLLCAVPHMSLSSENCVWCPYTNFLLDSKNCYLVYGGWANEEVMYSTFVNDTRSSVDCLSCRACGDCYACINGDGLVRSTWCVDCRDSSDLHVCRDCTDCSFCTRSSGLRGVSYYYENVAYTKEAYFEKIQQIRWSTGYLEQQWNIWPNTSNLIDCFACSDTSTSSWVSYCHAVSNATYSYDMDFMAPHGALRGYELCTSSGTNNAVSCYLTRFCEWVYYCYACKNCTHCFWCVGLRDASYCIFNVQYTKQDYESLVAKLIAHMQEAGEWGEFFHPSLSPFGYNETVAQEWYPMLQEQLDLCWYKWSAYQSPKPSSDKVLQWAELPERIEEVEETILHYAIACEITGKLFRILPEELAFYRTHGIPLPRKHPDQRHQERMQVKRKGR